MSFHEGQKVVCIDDSFPANHRGIRKGAIYTIAHTYERFVLLVEIPHQPTDGWFAGRFRPLDQPSTETGMAILCGILNGEPVKETTP